MIFITIGTQAPFDRLIKAVDEIAKNFPNHKFIAQVLGGQYQPHTLKLLDFLDPAEFDSLFKAADLVIGHAGTGTIITALTHKKPLIVMPRRAEFTEHRNNHQVATANKISMLGYVYVANNELELVAMLTNMLTSNSFEALYTIDSWASPTLITSLKSDICTLLNI